MKRVMELLKHINRPHRRNAFTPDTIQEMIDAFSDARDDSRIGVALLTGFNPQTDGKFAFCSGGDQKIRGEQKRWVYWF